MRDGRDTPAAVVMVVDGGIERVVGRVDVRLADLALVDALARCQLAARRQGRTIRLRDVSVDLCTLLELVGLADLLDD